LKNGKVLIVGGGAELYDPGTGTFTTTGQPNFGHVNHTATLLLDGRVLVVGGGIPPTPVATVDIYDPVTGTWSQTESMKQARYEHAATLLPSGKVLVTGGNMYDDDEIATSELYDPASGTWTNTGPLNMPRHIHAAASLSDGQVLVTGGQSWHFGTYNLAESEIYDAQQGLFIETGSLHQARIAPVVTTIPDGQIVVTGGRGYGPQGTQSTHWAYPVVELYDAVLGKWVMLPDLQQGRFGHTATFLPGHGLLIVGGFTTSYERVLQSVELIQAVPTYTYVPFISRQ
jgi:hypothetical protein